MMSRNNLRVLLLQFREDEATLQEEYQEFVRYTGLAPSQITQLNAWYTTDFVPAVVNNYDCVLVGGSSAPSVTEPDEYPFIRPAMALMKHCYDIGMPLFASCFGFQLSIQALGGLVETTKHRQEIDVLPVSLSQDAQDDPLFSDMPDVFYAVSIHRDSATTVPSGAVVLATTAVCPVHAIRMKGKPFYATQFHPEINKSDLIARWNRYWRDYPDNQEHEGRFDASPEVSDAHVLLSRFIDRVVLSSVE